jgi:hypothetical protein
MLENALDGVAPQLEDKLNTTTNATSILCNDQENVNPYVQQTNNFLSAKLKKKEVQSKKLRRKKSWLDKLLNGKRKPTKFVASQNKGGKVCANLDMTCCYHSFLKYLLKNLLQQQNKHDGVEPQVGAEKKDGSDKGTNLELQECNMFMSYTELLIAPSSVVYNVPNVF